MTRLFLDNRGRLVAVAQPTDGGKDAYRRPWSKDSDYRLPNDVEAILTFRTDHNRSRITVRRRYRYVG
jgi:hypothetical protein